MSGGLKIEMMLKMTMKTNAGLSRGCRRALELYFETVLFPIICCDQYYAYCAFGASHVPRKNIAADVEIQYAAQYPPCHCIEDIDDAVYNCFGAIEQAACATSAYGRASGYSDHSICTGTATFLGELHKTTNDSMTKHNDPSSVACTENSPHFGHSARCTISR